MIVIVPATDLPALLDARALSDTLYELPLGAPA